jgi:hypothetical protein
VNRSGFEIDTIAPPGRSIDWSLQSVSVTVRADAPDCPSLEDGRVTDWLHADRPAVARHSTTENTMFRFIYLGCDREFQRRFVGGEAGIRTLRPRLSNSVMARDFWF